jgi:hypothetical protein
VRVKTWRLRGVNGEVSLSGVYGRDPVSGRWCSPTRESLGLRSHQTVTPEVAARECLVALHARSYQSAAVVLRAVGMKADDSTIHRTVQRFGADVQHLHRERARGLDVPAVRQQMSEEGRRRLGRNPAALNLMGDGWMARERGPGWGKKETAEPRSVWREIKTAIIFQSDQHAPGSHAPGRRERGQIVDKSVLIHVGEPDGLGRAMAAEALRRGIAHAPAHGWASDGGPWLWAIQQTWFPHAVPTLDFYHCSEHIHQFAGILKGPDQGPVLAASLLHDLRHGAHDRARHRAACLAASARKAAALPPEQLNLVNNHVAYLTDHKEHICYAEREQQGWCIGTGAMEATCSELQRRFKGPGQFWCHDGRANLMALEQAHRNGDWPGVFGTPPQLN